MLTDRLEGKWIDLFAGVFALCKVAPGDACAILSESQSRALHVQLAELALLRLGARPFCTGGSIGAPGSRTSPRCALRSAC